MTMTAEAAQSYAERIETDLAARTAAIENGGMTRNPNGTWRATTGWDAHEVIGQDGLMTTKNGVALVYSGATPWHQMGEFVEDLDVDTALVAGGLDFDVQMRPIFWGATEDSKMGTDKVTRGHFQRAIVKVDPNAEDAQRETILGITGRIYVPIQNLDAFGFLTGLVGNGRVRIATAGALGVGDVVFMSVELPDSVELQGVKGSGDVVKKYVTVVNYHDGEHSLYARVTPIRPVCRNTLRYGTASALSQWKVRHTANAMQRLEEAQRTLALTGDYFTEFTAEATTLINTRMTDRNVEELLDRLYPLPEDSKSSAYTRRMKMRDDIRERVDSDPEQENCRGTAWAFENAVTGRLDWGTPVKLTDGFLADVRAPKSLQEDIARNRRLIDVDLSKDVEREKTRVHQTLLTWASR